MHKSCSCSLAIRARSAITGKAWNHPAIAGDRLYVRSDAEMACIQLLALDPAK
jgi:hypothetical protein